MDNVLMNKMLDINFILYWIIKVVYVYCVVWFYSVALEVKADIKIICITYYILDFFNTELIGDTLNLYAVKSCIYLLYEFLMVIFLYNGRLKKKIICYLQVTIVLMFIEIFDACFVTITNLGMDKITDYGVARTIILFMDLLITVVSLFVILKLQKKMIYSLEFIKLKTIIICYGVQVLAAFFFAEGIDLFNSRTMIIYIFLIIPADIYLIIYLRTMEVKQLTEEKVKYIEKQNEIIIKYCDCINSKTNELEKLRNDYVGRIESIYKISKIEIDAQDNIKSQSVIKKFEGMKSDSHKGDKGESIRFQNDIICEVVNNITAQIFQNTFISEQYEKHNFIFDIKFDIPKNINIKALDLSTLLMNMLENAVEAVEKQKKEHDEFVRYEGETDNCHIENEEEFYIKAYGKYDGEKLMISVKNSKSKNQKISRVSNKYITTKTNKAAHGYGLQIIENITGKYGGKMKVTYGEDWFLNEVILYFKNH